MYLGEVLNPAGERWEVQFKGAGRTHFSRAADGRKVLRSSLREFLCSEANAALGVPTTRAGTLVASDDRVLRDINYDGNAKAETCAVVLRIAPSFLRFGSFEICRPTDEITGREGPSARLGLERRRELLGKLLDHVGALLLGPAESPPPDSAAERQAARKRRWLAAFAEIVRRTAVLVASWQCAGFVHGVLNTDNLSVLGLTIDYGPYGFLEAYDPEYTPNGSDDSARYTYAAQPAVCRWNCETLAGSLAHILSREETAPLLEAYDRAYEEAYLDGMRAKLGLRHTALGTDGSLVASLLDVMQEAGSDWTDTWRALANGVDQLPGATDAAMGAIADRLVATGAAPARLAESARRKARTSASNLPVGQLMQFLHVAHTAPQQLAALGPVEQVKADLMRELEKHQKAEALLETAAVLEKVKPEERRAQDGARWVGWLREYQARLAHDDEAAPGAAAGRRERMRSVNPRVVLRTWIAQEAIAAAEAGDNAGVERVLGAVTEPFADSDDHFASAPPAWADGLGCVT
jgi:uncharacterized protein YdiU (UPF0061 family)